MKKGKMMFAKPVADLGILVVLLGAVGCGKRAEMAVTGKPEAEASPRDHRRSRGFQRSQIRLLAENVVLTERNANRNRLIRDGWRPKMPKTPMSARPGKPIT